MSRLQFGLRGIGLGIVCLGLFVLPVKGQILVCDYYSESTQQVVEFNGDGTFVRSFDTPPSALQVPAGMAVGGGSDLFVSSQGTGEVLRYDWKTGVCEGAFASNLYAPSGLLYDAATNSLYVDQFGNLNGQEIVRYNVTTGAVIARFGVGNYTGASMAMDGSGKLYVSDLYSGVITRFDPANNYAATPFAWVSGASGINGLAFDRSGNLNVAGGLLAPPHAIFQIDSSGTVVPAITDGLSFPSGMTLDADGNLLVANMGNYSAALGSIGKYDPIQRTVIQQDFITNGPNFEPSAVAVEPNAAFWTGGAAGDASWKNGANWWRSAPGNSATICFGATDGGHTTNDNDFDPHTAFGGITFTRDAPAYTLAGNSINLSGPVINQSGADTQTINLDLELVPGGGLFDTGPKNITVNGAIGGDGSILKQGDGALTLTGALNYAGSTTVAAGTLVVAGALDSPAVAVLGDSQLFAASIVADTLTVGGTSGAGAPANRARAMHDRVSADSRDCPSCVSVMEAYVGEAPLSREVDIS